VADLTGNHSERTFLRCIPNEAGFLRSVTVPSNYGYVLVSPA
jgi:hypothetical protein